MRCNFTSYHITTPTTISSTRHKNMPHHYLPHVAAKDGLLLGVHAHACLPLIALLHLLAYHTHVTPCHVAAYHTCKGQTASWTYLLLCYYYVFQRMTNMWRHATSLLPTTDAKDGLLHVLYPQLPHHRVLQVIIFDIPVPHTSKVYFTHHGGYRVTPYYLRQLTSSLLLSYFDVVISWQLCKLQQPQMKESSHSA